MLRFFVVVGRCFQMIMDLKKETLLTAYKCTICLFLRASSKCSTGKQPHLLSVTYYMLMFFFYWNTKALFYAINKMNSVYVIKHKMKEQKPLKVVELNDVEAATSKKANQARRRNNMNQHRTLTNCKTQMRS